MMKKLILKNTFYLTISNLIVFALRFLFIVEFSRILGKAELGRYSFALSLATIMELFVNFGLDVFLAKEAAADKKNVSRYVPTALFLKAALLVVNLAAVFLILFFTKDKSMLVIGMLFAASLFVDSIVRVFDAVFTGIQKMWVSAVFTTAKGIITFSTCLLILKLSPSLYFISFIFFVGSLLTMFSYWGVFLRSFPVGVSLDTNIARKLMKEGTPFLINAICVIIYFQMDTVMLSYMKTDADVGIYNAAYRLIYFVLFFPNQINRALFPAMVNISEKSKEELTRFYRFGFKVFLFLGIGLAAGTTVLAPKIIQLLYGKDFAASSICLQILIWAAALIYVNTFMGVTKITLNRQPVNTRIAVYAVMVNMALNFLLIPPYGYVGAGIATVAAEVTSFILHVYFLADFTRIKTILPWIIKVILINSGMVLFLSRILSLNLAVIIVAAVIMNIFLCFGLRLFDKKETRRLLSIVKLDRFIPLEDELL